MKKKDLLVLQLPCFPLLSSDSPSPRTHSLYRYKMVYTSQLAVLFSIGPALQPEVNVPTSSYKPPTPQLKLNMTYKSSCPVCKYLCRIKTHYETVNIKKEESLYKIFGNH